MDESPKSFAFLRRKARELSATRWSRKELAQVGLLKGAHQESIAPLLRDCPVKVLQSGEVLIQAGEPCTALYIVLSGRLQARGPTYIRAGDCLGELFLVRKPTLSTAVSAVETTRVLVIDRNTAWALVRSSHEIARNWLSLFAERSDASGAIDSTAELTTTHGRQDLHDESTGLHNRRWLEAMLPRQIARSVSSGEPLALLLAEVDGFADYVVQFGTATGERVCRTLADTLANSVRPTDIISCYGTAQFLVVLPGADIADACQAGEHVRQAMSRAGSQVSNEAGLPALTVSVGATQLQASSNASILLAAAEAALQMAKSTGGDRVGMR
jgi:diguanylate cyclase (GGDEF)-like protein